MTHLEQRMEQDLHEIREWVLKLGEDVENALINAKKTLVIREPELAYATVLGDQPINRDSRECDRLCHRFIARHLPGAGLLREMASTIRVNVALERIGDYAVTICREAMQLEQDIPAEFLSQMDAIADQSVEALRQARMAFHDGNADMAVATVSAAQLIQTQMDGIYERLFAADAEMDGRTMMALFVVFNLMKRVADQAKNICDQTIYYVRGIAKMPKVYKLLFLDQADSELGQLAISIGRKNFPQTAQFTAACPGGRTGISDELNQFIRHVGLPDHDLDCERLESLEHDFAGFTILVSLRGKVSDYVSSVPFHTTPLNWSPPQTNDFEEAYRYLRSEISNLVTLLAGEDAN